MDYIFWYYEDIQKSLMFKVYALQRADGEEGIRTQVLDSDTESSSKPSNATYLLISQ